MGTDNLCCSSAEKREVEIDVSIGIPLPRSPPRTDFFYLRQCSQDSNGGFRDHQALPSGMCRASPAARVAGYNRTSTFKTSLFRGCFTSKHSHRETSGLLVRLIVR